MLITVDPSVAKAPIQAVVGNAVSSFINGLPIGSELPLTKLAQIAYAASPSVINVSALSINGAPTDLLATTTGVIKAGTVAVN